MPSNHCMLLFLPVCILTGFYTALFNITSGLRQGCSLSQLLFNNFIDELTLQIRACGKGVKKIMILLASCSMQTTLFFKQIMKMSYKICETMAMSVNATLDLS